MIMTICLFKKCSELTKNAGSENSKLSKLIQSEETSKFEELIVKILLTVLFTMCMVGCSKNDGLSTTNNHSTNEQQNTKEESSENDIASPNINLPQITASRIIDCENPINEQTQFACTHPSLKAVGLVDMLNIMYEEAINSNCKTEADLLAEKIKEGISKCPLDQEWCFLGVMQDYGQKLAQLSGFCSGLNQ